MLDVLRQWLAYRLGTLATADIAIGSLAGAVTAEPDCPTLAIQCDNGSQHAGKKSRKAASLLGIRPILRTRTPEQNGHMEWLHGALKRERIWQHDFASQMEIEAATPEAFRGCNRAKPHSALKYVPPDEFMASWVHTQPPTRSRPDFDVTWASRPC